MLLNGMKVGADSPLFVIAGPCVIESEQHTLSVAEQLAGSAQRLGIRVIFKSSFDKANRSSGRSYRGPGLDQGLRILEKSATRPGWKY